MKNKRFYTTGLACAVALLVSSNTAQAADCSGNVGYCLTDGNAQFQINALGEMELLVNGLQHIWLTDFVVAEIAADEWASPYPLAMYDYIDFNQAPTGTYSVLNLTNMPLSNWGSVDMRIELIGGAVVNSATLIERFTLTNNSTVPQPVNMFAYTDVDVGGTDGYDDDWGELVGYDANGYPTAYRQYDDTQELITTLNFTPDNYEVSIGNGCVQDLCEKIYLGVNIILPNTVTPYQGDLNQAGEFVRTLQPGESFSYTQTMALSSLSGVSDTDFDKDGVADDLDPAPFDIFSPTAEGTNLSHSANFDDPLASDTDFLDSENLRILTWSNTVGAGATADYTITAGGIVLLSGSLSDLGDGTYSGGIALADLNYTGTDVVLDILLKKKKWKYSTSKTFAIRHDTNNAPVISVTSPVDGINYPSGSSVVFTCSAHDVEDGNITPSCTWTSNLDGNLGSGYSVTALLSNGIHTITAAVTDTRNRVSTDSIGVVMGTLIEVSTAAYKIKGKQVVDLTWINAGSSQVDVYRDGAIVATVSNTGAYTDNIGVKGSATYQYVVCDAGTTNCSTATNVVF